MGDGLVFTTAFILTLTALVAAVLLHYRAIDVWREQGRLTPLVIAIYGIVSVFCCFFLTETWQFLRWHLVHVGNDELSDWYVRHAYLTVPIGVAASISITTSGSALMWSAYRWRGVAGAGLGLVTAWLIGLRTAGLI